MCGHTDIPFFWAFKTAREKNVVMPFIVAHMAHDRRRGVYSIGRECDGGIEIVAPKSFQWDRMSQKKFAKVSNDITDFIKEYARLDFNEWLSHSAPRRYSHAA